MEKLEAMLLEKIKNTQGLQANAFRTLAQAMDAQSVPVQSRLGIV